MLNDVCYGSQEGGWIYPLINGNVEWPVKLGLLLISVIVPLVLVSIHFVKRWPILIVIAWLLIGTGTQRILRTLAPFPDHHVVGTKSDPFYHESTIYPPKKFLSEFRELAPHMQFHVRANLAGKVLFYHAVRTISDSPVMLMWLIMGISNLGGVLAYSIVSRLFANRTAGLFALILYLFLPSKLYFMPLMNTVTPVFILLPLWILVQYLADRRAVWLFLMGGTLYWCVLFEPLPLITGLTFLILITRAWGLRAISGRHVLAIFGILPATFMVVNVAIYQLYGYEIFSAFRFALEDARTFNESSSRAYEIWVIHNLIETLSGIGVLTAMLLLGIAGVGLYRVVKASRQGSKPAIAVMCEPALCLALSVLASLAVVDVLGINRGETLRLWIFWGVFAQLPVAVLCAQRPLLFCFLLAASLLQASIALGSRGFVFPG